MIFKTITDDLGNTKLSINNGLKGIFSGEYFKQHSILSDNDINALKAYNRELEKIIGYEVTNGQVLPVTTSAQTAFNRTMQDASIEAQNIAASANGMIVNLEQIPKTSKAAALELKALSIAGNMLLFMAIGKAISFATEKITELANASKIAREKSSELTNQWKEENSSIDQSIFKYKELKEKLNDTSISASEIKSIKEELLGVQDDLVEKYGNEALQIDLVNGKYDEQIAKLEKLSKLKAQEYVAENYSNIQEDRKYVTEKVNLNRSLGFKAPKSNPEDFSDAGFDLQKYLDKYETLDARANNERCYPK